MAKAFYFWQTISKRPNLDYLAFKRAKWHPCYLTTFTLNHFSVVFYGSELEAF